MKSVFLFLLFICTTTISMAQSSWSRVNVQEAGESKFGIVLSNGSWLLEPTYDEIVIVETISLPRRLFFRVQKGKRFGLFDIQGSEVIPVAYDWIQSQGHFFWVEQNGKRGAYNASGKKLLDCTYDNVFSNNYEDFVLINNSRLLLGFGSEGSFGIADTNGLIVVPPKFDFIFLHNGFFEALKNGKVSVFNSQGKELNVSRFNEFDGSSNSFFKSGALKVKEGAKWGAIDTLGKVILEPIYDEIYLENEKYITLKVNHKWGIANYAGTILLEPIYEDLFSDKYGRFIVYKKNSKRGMITTSGKEKLPLEYDQIWVRRYRVDIQKDNKSGVCDSLGNIILEARYKYIESHFNNEFVIYNDGERWGAKHMNGVQNIPAEFDELRAYPDWFYAKKKDKLYAFSSEGKLIFSDADEMKDLRKMFFFKKRGVWMGVDREGSPINSDMFEDVGQSISYGPLPVKKNGKWGYMDPSGEIVIPFMYEEARPFNNSGYATVKEDGDDYRINHRNRKLPKHWRPTERPYQVKQVPPPPMSIDYHNKRQLRSLPNVEKVEENEKIGMVIDTQLILPTIYDEILVSQLNLFLARKASTWLVLNTKGDTIFELKKGSIEPFYPLDLDYNEYHNVVTAKFLPDQNMPEIIRPTATLRTDWNKQHLFYQEKAKKRGYYLQNELRQKALFPGNYNAYNLFMDSTLVYPKKAVKLKESAVVYVYCVVDADGTISSIKVKETSQNPYFIQEAIRVVEAMPSLRPAINGVNENVRSERIFTFNFDFQEYQKSTH